MIPSIINRSYVDRLYKEGTPWPNAPGAVAAWTLDCSIYSESERGSDTIDCCCYRVYTANLSPIIPALLGIYDSSSEDSIANTEIHLTLTDEFLGSDGDETDLPLLLLDWWFCLLQILTD